MKVAASSQAELALQRGQYYSQRYNNQHRPEDFDLAFGAFQRALELDSALADAAAKIALLFVFRFEAGYPAEETAQQTVSWANRALEINPRSSRAIASLGAADLQQPEQNLRRQLL